MLPEILSVVCYLRVLVFEVLLELEQLVLQVIDLLLLRLETLTHFLCPVRQNMLGFPQILYLELVLVQISLTLLQLLYLFLLALFLVRYLPQFLVQNLLDLLPLNFGSSIGAFRELKCVDIFDLLLLLLVLFCCCRLDFFLFSLLQGLVLIIALDDLDFVLILLFP